MLPRSMSTLQAFIDRSLSFVDNWIWPSQQQRDADSRAFYVFKRYPASLKSNEIAQWATLQISSMSPFSQGDHYHYLSKKGLHLWVTADKFTGIPETACQMALADGQHLVRGNQVNYKQTWVDGTMHNCTAIPKSKTAQSSPLNFSKPWAVDRKLDEAIKKPSVWSGLCFFALFCILVWWMVGVITISVQEHHAEQEANELTDILGEKLTLQNELRNNKQLLNGLLTWQQEYNFLPESFAVVADKLNKQAPWQANTLIWQNKTMEVELLAKDIDITSLVSDLESIPSLQQISIRPHDAKDTWVLEAQIK